PLRLGVSGEIGGSRCDAAREDRQAARPQRNAPAAGQAGPKLFSAYQDLRSTAAQRRGARQMALAGDRITFWFGCNMLRHAEMIRLSIMLLERIGYDVSTAGGPAYCCGTAHDHQPRGASNMAGRTVDRFNDAAKKDGRSTVVTWCPSCHM